MGKKYQKTLGVLSSRATLDRVYWRLIELQAFMTMRARGSFRGNRRPTGLPWWVMVGCFQITRRPRDGDSARRPGRGWRGLSPIDVLPNAGRRRGLDISAVSDADVMGMADMQYRCDKP